jgi:acetylglutamate kinase
VEPTGSTRVSLRGNRRATPVAEAVRNREHASHTAEPVVVKIGGRALEAPGASRELAAEVTATPGIALLVHGGGAEVSAWCERLAIAPRFADGLRVTDQATLEVATAVLAGLANKRLVAALRARGLDAVGLSALDGGVIAAEPHPRADELGAVGAVAGVHPALLLDLLAAGRTPVLASIGAEEGRLLNLNADDVAAAVAGAIGAGTLVLLSDATGVRLASAHRAALDAGELDAALAGDEVQGGMRPKLRAARAALAHGVRDVWIAAWQGPGTLARLLAGEAIGTRVSAAAGAHAGAPGLAKAAVQPGGRS